MGNTAAGLAERFPAMQSYDFRRLFANGFFTTGSRWAQVLARGWLVHDLTDGSTSAVGWVTFASFIPFVVVGPVVGTLADRFDRRRLLIAATLFGVLGATILAVLTIADVVEVWHVGILAFATGSAQAASVPTRQALIANVVPAEHLLNAVALGGISQHGSRVVGPLFGAAFLARYGTGSVFVLSAVLLTIGLVDVLRMRYRSPRTETASVGVTAAVRRVGTDLAAAGRYVRRDARLLTVIALVGVHCSFTMAFDAMMPTLSEKIGGSS
ncbi:MAG: MFS transporter, partial [Actinomycetota bacterium]|nr:MFS transporter [Actinomycetota bacterium]